MVMIISGADSYRSRARLSVLISGFKKKYDPQGYNITRFDGQTLSFNDVQSALSTMSFLGSKRLVLFEQFFGNKLSESQQNILGYISERDGHDQVVIFWQREELPAAAKRVGFVKKAKQENFPELADTHLARYLQAEIEKRKLKCAPEAMQLLRERIGGDTWALANTLDQLKAYVGQKTASRKDVEQFTSEAYDENIFHFTDALGKRHAKEATTLLFDQLRSGAHPLYILTMLVRQFRLLLAAYDHSPQELISEMRVHPYSANMAKQQSRLFSKKELAHAFDMLIQMDQQLKTGFKDAETLLTRFVMSMTNS